MPVPYLDHSRSRAAFDEIARHVAGGESSYARLRAGQELVITEARGAAIRDLDGNEYLMFCDGPEARGVYAHRYALGRWSLSLVHRPAEIEHTLEAVRGAVEDLTE